MELLSNELVSRILDEAFELMLNPGIKVLSQTARQLLAEGGAEVQNSTGIVRVPERLARRALDTAPKSFLLYNRLGEARVTYGGNAVQFDPGSSAVHVLDPETLQHRPAKTADLVRLVKVAEMLPEYEAQSTAVICDDVPSEIGDIYRLHLVLMYSVKPVITGAFSHATLQRMIDMLAGLAGGAEALATRPQAVFDVCPSPPLIWSDFGAENFNEACRRPRASRNRVHASGRRGRASNALGGHHTACGRMPEWHHNPSACTTRSSHCVGWGSSDF